MKKFLMMSGMLAALVYVGTAILGGLLRPGYSHLAEAISELVAADAPNRTLLSPLFLLYDALLGFFRARFISQGHKAVGRTRKRAPWLAGVGRQPPSFWS